MIETKFCKDCEYFMKDPELNHFDACYSAIRFGKCKLYVKITNEKEVSYNLGLSPIYDFELAINVRNYKCLGEKFTPRKKCLDKIKNFFAKKIK